MYIIRHIKSTAFGFQPPGCRDARPALADKWGWLIWDGACAHTTMTATASCWRPIADPLCVGVSSFDPCPAIPWWDGKSNRRTILPQIIPHWCLCLENIFIKWTLTFIDRIKYKITTILINQRLVTFHSPQVTKPVENNQTFPALHLKNVIHLRKIYKNWRQQHFHIFTKN